MFLGGLGFRRIVALLASAVFFLIVSQPVSAGDKFQYDIAIMAIGGELKENMAYGVLYSVIETSLENKGSKTIFQAGVECRMGAIAFRPLSGGREYKPGESHTFIVQTETPLSRLPSGPQNVTCLARIMEPKGVTDENAANDVLAGKVNVPAPPRAGLSITHLDLKDCASRGLEPTDKSPLCAVVKYENFGEAITNPWDVKCELDQNTARTGPAPSPTGKGEGSVTVPMDKAASGWRNLTCTLDPANKVSGADSPGLRKKATASVFVRVGDPRYDLAIKTIGETLREATLYGKKYTLLETTLANKGNMKIFQAGVECRMDTITFMSLSGGREYMPGESHMFTVATETPISKIPGGVHAVACRARIVLPGNVADADRKNDAMTGKVTVQRISGPAGDAPVKIKQAPGIRTPLPQR